MRSTAPMRSIAEVCEKPQYGWTTKSSAEGNTLKLLRITDIQDGGVDWATVPYCVEEPKDFEKFVLKPDDIVVARSGATVGKSYLIRHPEPSVFASYLIRLRAKDEVVPRYLGWFLQSADYWQQIAGASSGIAQPNVNATKLAGISLPVPAVDLQNKIADAIETHLSHLDAGVESLRRAKLQAERLWASALREAMTTSQHKPLEAFAAPGGITDGPFGSRLKTSHYTPAGPRVLRLQNIGRGEFIDDRSHIAEDHFNSLLKHEAKAGDLLVASLYGDQLRNCVVPEHVGPAVVKADCIRVRPSDEVDVQFLSFALQRPDVDAWCEVRVKGVGRQRLGLSAIRAMPVPDFQPATQRQVASRLSLMRANLDHMLDEITQAKIRATTLRQGVLSYAFQGKLTHQQRMEQSA